MYVEMVRTNTLLQIISFDMKEKGIYVYICIHTYDYTDAAAAVASVAVYS